jgi:hypothetical protein
MPPSDFSHERNDHLESVIRDGIAVLMETNQNIESFQRLSGLVVAAVQ